MKFSGLIVTIGLHTEGKRGRCIGRRRHGSGADVGEVHTVLGMVAFNHRAEAEIGVAFERYAAVGDG